MSSGQRPRWPAYFPRMKRRGRYRPHRARIVVYSANWEPIWPPALHVDGQTVRVDRDLFRINGRVLDRKTGLWNEEVDHDA